MPERFHFARVDGLRPVVARVGRGDRDRLPAAPAGAGARRRPAAGPAALRDAGHQPLRARLQRRRDRPAAAAAGAACRPHPAARLRDLPAHRARGRRPRRAGGADPRRSSASGRAAGRAALVGRAPAAPRRPRTSGGQGSMRTSYAGDDVFLSLSARPARRCRAAPPGGRRARSAPTATCRCSTTSRRSTLESGDPVQAVTLLGALRPPRPALPAAAARPASARAAPTSWPGGWSRSSRSTTSGSRSRAARRSRCARRSTLYADRGDPGLARHAQAHRRRRRPAGDRAAADRRADVLRPRHRGHARRSTRRVSPATARCCCRRCSRGSSPATPRSTPSCGPGPGSCTATRRCHGR